MFVFSEKSGPVVKNQTIIFSNFIIKNNNRDNWFLTKNKEIVSFTKIIFDQNTKFYSIFGQKIIHKTDFYEYPIKSSKLDIFSSNGSLDAISEKLEDIHSKLFCITDTQNNKVFFPILHTKIN